MAEELLSSEVVWRDRQPFLLSHGYQLRPRFRPDWLPSWKGTDHNPFRCEDGQTHFFDQYIDATRERDNETVVLKAVPPDSSELHIATLFSEPQRKVDPDNHCVQIWDHIQGGSESELDFIVMPCLREWDHPPFVVVGEVVDFIQQTLEGIEYMHRNGVAHRDCAKRNIMMDPRPLLKERVHPAYPDLDPTLTKVVYPLQRRNATSPVKYYFIDFGLSSHFPDPSEPRLVTGSFGVERSPELSDTIPYDPFKVDIWILGNMYQENFVNTFDNMSFLTPLTKVMTLTEPDNRPTAREALNCFLMAKSELDSIALKWRLQPSGESMILRFCRDLQFAILEVLYTVANVPYGLLRLINGNL